MSWHLLLRTVAQEILFDMTPDQYRDWTEKKLAELDLEYDMLKERVEEESKHDWYSRPYWFQNCMKYLDRMDEIVKERWGLRYNLRLSEIEIENQ